MATATLCKLCTTQIGERLLCPLCLTDQSSILPAPTPQPLLTALTRPISAGRRLRRLRRASKLYPMLTFVGLLMKGVLPSIGAHTVILVIAAFILLAPVLEQNPEVIHLSRRAEVIGLVQPQSEEPANTFLDKESAANQAESQIIDRVVFPTTDTSINDVSPITSTPADMGLGERGDAGIELVSGTGLLGRSGIRRASGPNEGRSNERADKESAIGHRQGSGKQEAVERHGGQDTLEAVDRALAWLASIQMPDGSWDSTGARLESISGKTFSLGAPTGVYDIGVSALSLLCFLGAGHTDTSGDYSTVVAKGLKWLEGQQNLNGSFGADGMQAYNTAVATLTFAEANALCSHRRFRRPATRAIGFWQKCQNSNGGWSYYSGNERYKSDERSDASITGWIVLALKTAKLGGLTVRDSVWERAQKCYELLGDSTTGETIYADKPSYAGRRGIAMTGVGLASRRLLNPKENLRIDTLAVGLLLKKTPKWDDLKEEHLDARKPNFNSLYGWYYSSLGMFFATGGEGEVWEAWNDDLKRALVPNQKRIGDEAGSWDPVETWFGPYCGRVYSTAMACLTLEVYYRHEPEAVYRIDGLKPAEPPPTE